MSNAELPLARAGVEAAGRRLRRYARAATTTVRFGEDWIAVATGVRANDMNGVVSGPHALISIELIDNLLAWFKEERLPASWLVAENDPVLASALVGRGARPEATGWWAGRFIGGELLLASPPTDTLIRPVRAEADLEDWLEVAGQCGWFDEDDDRRARRELYRSVGLDDRELAHWVAYGCGQPVGMASSFVSTGGVVDLCNLAVLDRERRRGIGRALACERIRAAHDRGATTIVSALSPDGWQLYRSLGFASVPVESDRWFYLPAFDE